MIDIINSTSFVYEPNDFNFTCGVDKIDTFFSTMATQYETSRIATTLLFYDDNEKVQTEILKGFITYGFTTVNLKMDPAIQSELSDLKFEEEESPFGTRDRVSVFPVMSINFFAVAEKLQRNKFGSFMMLTFFERMIDLYINRHICFTGIVLSAISDSTDFYESMGFGYLGSSPDDCLLQEYKMFINIEKIMDIYSEFSFGTRKGNFVPDPNL